MSIFGKKVLLFEQLNELMRVAFALSFLLARCIVWPFVVYELACDLRDACLGDGTEEDEA